MSLRLQPYAAYKDSGVAWLGQIPAHWKMQRTKYLFDERVQKGFPDEPLLAATQTKGVVPKSHYESRTVTAQKDLHLLKLVEVGDYVISLRSFQGGIEYAHFRGIISPAYTVLKPAPKATVTRDYFEFLFKSSTLVDGLTLFVTGIREGQNIDYQRLSRSPLPVPPLEEQRAIGRFLRHALAKANQFIRAKRRLVELLHEQKQALIHRAVTRGLDSDVQMQSSRMEWLEKVPNHWEWMPIKRLLSRMDYGTSEASQEVGNIRVLTMGNIQQGEVFVPTSGGLDSVPDVLLLEHQDLLFTRTNGNPDLVGKVGIFRGQVTDKVSFASYLVRLRVKYPNNPQWLHFILNSSAFWPFARSFALVNLQTNLNATRYGQFLIPVPPPSEQAKIVQIVNEELETLQHTIMCTEREIELIREYRTRLITDVVTGKWDVRGIPVSETGREWESIADEIEIDMEDTDAADVGEDVEDARA